jgi:hypothetical protein
MFLVCSLFVCMSTQILPPFTAGFEKCWNVSEAAKADLGHLTDGESPFARHHSGPLRSFEPIKTKSPSMTGAHGAVMEWRLCRLLIAAHFAYV